MTADAVAVSCPLCGGDDVRPVARVTTYSRPLRMVRCRGCGLLHMNPRPSSEALDDLYHREYYGGSSEYSYVDDRTQEAQVFVRAAGRLARVEALLDRDGVRTRKLVELGCSFGTFLDEARRRGWDAAGCEISDESGGWAREHRGLVVHPHDLADAGLAPGELDLVTASEVIEHLTDPVRTVRAALKALRPRGVVLFSTGNENSVARLLRGARWGYYMPGHLTIWSPRTLSRLLADAGFVEIDVTAGDERGLGNFLAFRKAAGGGSVPGGSVLGWLVKRLRLGGLTVGAGMVVTARKPGVNG